MDEQDYKARIVAALERNATRGTGQNWAVPAAAGGISDYDSAVDAFCQVANIQPAELTDKVRRQWARVLEKVADEHRASPRTLVDAILAKPQSTIGWKAWTTPYASREDLSFLILQAKGGGVQVKETRQSHNAAIMSAWGNLPDLVELL